MSTTYNGNLLVYPTGITIPGDLDPESAASVNVALQGLADRTEHIANRRLPFVLNGVRNRPGDAIVSVPTGATVKVHSSGVNLLATYNTNTIAVLANLVLDVRQSSGGVVSCDVTLGTTSNATDTDSAIIQRWDIPASSMPRTIAIAAWLTLAAGSPITSFAVYAKIANASSATIDVYNSSLSGVVLKNGGL